MFTARPHSRNLGVVQITSRRKDEQAGRRFALRSRELIRTA
jgi:hypothetical protein